MAFVVGELVAPISADARQFLNSLKEVRQKGELATKGIGKKFEELGKKIGKVGQQMSLKVSLPLLGAGLSAAKFASDFETSFAGVRKTVDGTEADFEQLARGMRDLAAGDKAIPVDVDELNAIGEAAGQLGIEIPNILDFTKVMAKLGVTTNLTSEQAATALARMSNIMGTAQTDVDRMGSTIVGLGNNMATTEREIVEMGLRLAGAGKQIGLTEAQVFGFSAALSSVGVEAEAGGTAFSRVFANLAQASAQGGKDLDAFAEIAGMSSEKLKESFEKDAAGAVVQFLNGLQRIDKAGGDVFTALETVGFANVRVRDALLRTANAGDLVTDALSLATDEWEKNNALTEEAEKRFATTGSQLKIMQNRIKEAGIEIGTNMLPTIVKLADVVGALARKFAALPEPIQNTVIVLGALTAAIGPIVWMIGTLITNIGVIAPVAGKVFGVLLGLFGKLGVAIAGIGATTAALAVGFGAVAASLGVIIGTVIRPYVEELLQLDEALGKIANVDVDVAEGIADDRDRFHDLADAVDRYRKRLGIAGKASREQSVENVIALQGELGILHKKLEKKKAEEAAAKKKLDAEAAEQDAIEAKTGAIKEESEEIQELITKMEDRLRQAKLSEEAYLLEKLAAEGASEATQKKAAELFRATRAAEEDKKQADARSKQLQRDSEQREASIQSTIEALEAEKTALEQSAEAQLYHSLMMQGANEWAAAYAVYLQSAIKARRESNEMEVEAARIKEDLMTKEERLAQQLERLREIYEAGKFTIDEYNEAVKRTKLAYEETAKKAEETLDKTTDYAQGTANALSSSFRNLFVDPMNASFKEVGRGFLVMIQNMIAQAMAARLAMAFLGIFTGGGSTGASLFSAGPTPVPVATGGHIKGPGTSTSDSIPAFLSDEEFVIQAAATRKYGTGLLHAINSMTLPKTPPGVGKTMAASAGRFSKGGLAGQTSATFGSEPTGSGGYNIIQVDARESTPGVERRIMNALRTVEDRAVKRSITEVANRRLRGGNYGSLFR